jgi:ketosteroid isomerase-like protein
LLGRAIRRGYAATTRGDYELSLSFLDSNVEVEMRESAAVSADLVGVHRGHDGWLHLVGELVEVFEFGWLPEEVLDCGQQAMITLRLETRGRGSGVPISHYTFDVLTWRDGLVIRQEIFGDRQEALEAVGMRE